MQPEVLSIWWYVEGRLTLYFVRTWLTSFYDSHGEKHTRLGKHIDYSAIVLFCRLVALTATWEHW